MTIPSCQPAHCLEVVFPPGNTTSSGPSASADLSGAMCSCDISIPSRDLRRAEWHELPSDPTTYD